MKTFVEFVESDATVNELIEASIDYAQGYGIGKPKPFIEVISQFRNNV